MQRDLRQILEPGLAAADPEAAVLRSLWAGGDCVFVGEEQLEAERVFVLSAAEDLLGDRLAGGLIVTKHGNEASSERLEVLFASHPEPEEGGAEAARRVTRFVEDLGEGGLLLALISGGASALLADPAPPIELADLKELTSALSRSGADIEEINAVRKHLSILKGGGLVRLAAPARTLALLLSDVVGDEFSSIASGLSAPDPTTLEDVSEVMERYSLEPPQSVRERLKDAPETAKPGDPVFEGVTNILVGGGRVSAEAAAHKARELGYEPSSSPPSSPATPAASPSCMRP